MKTSHLVLLIVVTLIVVEAMLGLRVWIQSTSGPMDRQGVVSLFDTTDVVASPASLLTGKDALRESGVVDFTVLVAIEAYLVGALVLVLVIIGVNGGWKWLMALRSVQLPEFVVEQMEQSRVRRVWQPAFHAGNPRRARRYVVHLGRRNGQSMATRRA